MRKVYLDYAATTPVRPEVLAAMLPCFTENAGNASSLHQVGQRAKRALESARQTVATAIGAEPSEIVFTSGGTESDNLAIIGTVLAVRGRGKHLITSAIEHHAVLNTCEYLETQGYEVTYLGVDRHGAVDPEALRASLRDDTALVSVMLANNEVGTVQPVAEIARLAHARGALVHTDAIQAIGKMPVRVDDLGVDLLSLTAHKFNGPKGVGALYIRRGTPIRPLLHGGHHEDGMRPGTQNVAGSVGLAEALRLAVQEQDAESQRVGALRARLEAGILQRIPQTTTNGHPGRHLPNILNVSFAGIEGESLLLALDVKGIAVSTGSACAAGATEPSPVLRAMGLPRDLALSALRFSLGHGTTEEEIDYTLDALVQVVARLRAVSPLYQGEGALRRAGN